MTNSPLLIITGQSGGGLSSVLKCLEDSGYEVFDNFPLDLIPALLDQKSPHKKPIALGVDTRTRRFSSHNLKKMLSDVRTDRLCQLVFINCHEDKIQQRFSETRRAHPLAQDRPFMDGIQAEREILAPIKLMADTLIDTTDLSIHDLRRTIKATFGDNERQPLTLNILSFSYKKGLPRESDIVFDVRFLQNPHWDDHLRKRTGKDKKVGAYIEKDPAFSPFMTHLEDMLTLLLPAYETEGKHYLTIAFGCTGGRHRSVFCAQTLTQWLSKNDFVSQVHHRDLV